MTWATAPPAATAAPAPASIQGSELGAGRRGGALGAGLRISVTVSMGSGEAILVTALSVWAGRSARICMLARAVGVAAAMSTLRQQYAARRTGETPRGCSVTWSLRRCPPVAASPPLHCHTLGGSADPGSPASVLPYQ